MNRPIKILLFTFYFLFLIGVTGKLFLEEHFDRFFSFFTSFRTQEGKELFIGFSEPTVRLDPLANDTGSRSRLFHIYEALVFVNPDLQIKPSLAIVYGSLDDLTWEFRLRPGVAFQNAAPLTIEDVFYSIEEARKNPNSGVKDLASGISELKKIDSQIFRIITQSPDPLLLQKLSQILIFPKNASQEKPIGTGPFAFEKNENGILTLRRFNAYWDKKPAFETVHLKTFTSKEEKLAALKNHTVHIVANVPPDAARRFQFPGFALKTRPSLEVNFLIFHFDKTFRDRRLREAVQNVLSVTDLAKLTRGFAVPAAQFVGNGIFGYDPEIALQTPDPKRAEELVKEVSNFARIKIQLDLPEGLEIFGTSVANQLKKIGIDTELNYSSASELGRKIQNRETEFFFFGWRSDLGDASDFLTAVVHGPSGNFGQFNGGNYRNVEVDRLIEMSGETIEQETRLKFLRAVMKKITTDDIIGIPLFSPEVLYGVSEEVKFSPRVDGYVLAQEVKI
jgi:peptide/nickel transport system substrate-binding protein